MTGVRLPYTVRWREGGRRRQKSFATRREAKQLTSLLNTDIYARIVGGALGQVPISDERRERLAVLFSGPWLNEDDDDAYTKSTAEEISELLGRPYGETS